MKTPSWAKKAVAKMKRRKRYHMKRYGNLNKMIKADAILIQNLKYQVETLTQII